MKPLTVKETGEKIYPTKIICLARTYRKHAEEMNSEVPSEPILFLKPPSAIIHSSEKIVIPEISKKVHYEGELAVIIGKNGKNIPKEEAHSYISGYSAFLDITARDLQSYAKSKGYPWSISKGFDTFAPVSPVTKKEYVDDPHNLSIKLWVNDQIRQNSNTKYMIFTIYEIIEYISRIMTLEKGDVIATGTPEGVGEIKRGDRIVLEIEKVGKLENYVV